MPVARSHIYSVFWRFFCEVVMDPAHLESERNRFRSRKSAWPCCAGIGIDSGQLESSTVTPHPLSIPAVLRSDRCGNWYPDLSAPEAPVCIPGNVRRDVRRARVCAPSVPPPSLHEFRGLSVTRAGWYSCTGSGFWYLFHIDTRRH